VRIYFALWNNGSFVATTTANDIGTSSITANTWYGFRIRATLPSGTYNQITYHLDLPTSASAGTLDLSSVRLEQIDDATMLYADGADTADGWSWDDATLAGNTTSTQQDIQQVAVDDTGVGTDTVTVVDLVTVDDTGTGTDTVTVSDSVAESVIVDDTGTGTDTVTVSDFEPVTVDDTALGVDELTIVDQGTYGDTAVGTDTVAVVDVLDTLDDTGVGSDDVAVLDVPHTRLLPHRTGPVYELMAVARVPAAVGPPMFIEVDPIRWTSLQYTNELSRAQSLEATCLVSTLPDSIKQRLHPKAPPTELWLLRNGEVVFAGPLGGGRRGDGGTLTLSAHGLLAYLRRMIVHADLVYPQKDQFVIVKALVDHWQDVRPFGHYGIDTSQVGTSGQLRDATYLRDELHPIGQRVEEMGRRINGFDIDVDPGTRRLQLWHPLRGMDRSDGEDAVVFDTRHITSGSVMFSFAPDDLATEAFGTGTSPDHDTVYAALVNEELRAQHGASAVVGNWDGVSQQATLDEHVQALLDARQEALFVPSPNLRVTPDADLTAYSVGDTISYDVDEQLGVTGAFRIRSQQITVAESGQESVSLTFV
jgi:hypothetical protein